jgi:hypothetical protein
MCPKQVVRRFLRANFYLSSEEAMTRRQRENLYLVFWIGVVSVELAVLAWLI